MQADKLRIDLTDARWFKSSRSSGNTDNCVEVAFVHGAVAVRDSKDRQGPALRYTSDEWNSFIAGVKSGEFDL